MLILLAGAALAGAVTALVPLGLVALPAFFAYAMGRTKPAFLALFGGVYAAAAVFLYPWLTAAGFCILCIGMAAALYWMQTRGQSNTYTALALLGIALAALYAMVCLPGILSGAGAFAPIQAAAEEFAAIVKEMAAVMPGIAPEALAQLNALAEQLSGMAAAMTVPVLCVLAQALGFINLLLFKALAKMGKLKVTPMRPFRLWAIPQSMTYGLVFLLLASLALEWTGWEYAESLSNTVNILVGMPLVLQGLCVVDFMIVRGGKNIAQRRILFYLGGWLVSWLMQMPLLFQTPLMMVGCFDQIFRFRARLSGMPPIKPPRGL